MPTDPEDFDWIAPLLSAHAARHDLDADMIVNRVMTQVRTATTTRRRRSPSPLALVAAFVVLIATAASALPALANWLSGEHDEGTVRVQGTRPATGTPASAAPTAGRGPSPSSTSAGPTPSGSTGSTRRLGLTTGLKWRSSGPLVAPEPDPGHPVMAVKDPTVVYHAGRWHLFATDVTASGLGLEYRSFTDWSQAAAARPYYLDQSGIGAGYRAAPQVFYFAPQRLWYLVYQTGNASYSTNPDIANPAGWSAPKDFYPGMPAIIARNIGSGFWVDMWVICDASTCYLYSSDENGHLYRSQTSLADFPHGMSQPVIAVQEADPNRLHEAGKVFTIAGTHQYLLLAEAVGSDGRRYSRSWTASSAAGPWTPLASSQANPFAGAGTVADSGTRWSLDISHGEPLRTGVDQTLSLSPCHLRYVYDGHDPTARGAYSTLPWQLGLLTQTNSAC